MSNKTLGTLLSPKTYTIRGLFWRVYFDDEKKTTDIASKQTIAECQLIQGEAIKVGDMIGKALELMNPLLPQFLKDNGLYRWFPARTLTCDFYDDIFEICYYHKNNIHDIAYQIIDQGYVMEPNMCIRMQLHPFYESYGFGMYDEYVYASEYDKTMETIAEGWEVKKN